VEFDWLTFGLEIVNFLILVWILKRFLYQPVMRAIARRKAAIEQTLADAKARHDEASALEGRYRDRLAAWEKEKQALRAQADEELGAERTRRMAALAAALDQERERRRVVEERELDEWRRHQEDAAIEQGARFASRLLARLAAPDLEARLVVLALEDLRGLPEEPLEALRSSCRATEMTMRVASAYPLSEDQRAAFVRVVRQVTRSGLEAEFTEDPQLLAGLRVSIGPWVMHSNMQDELKFFAQVARRGA
jgi:F-type H+-transporting ATPase subunit b